MSCNSEEPASLSQDVLHMEPIDTIRVFGDSLFFNSISDIEVMDQTFYFSLSKENTIIQTNADFEVAGVLRSTGKGPG